VKRAANRRVSRAGSSACSPKPSDHLVSAVPNLGVGEALHDETGSFESSRLRIVGALVDQAAVVPLTVDLNDQSVLAVDEVDTSEPPLTTDVDLARHRGKPRPLEKIAEATLEATRLGDIVGTPLWQDQAHCRCARPSPPPEVVEYGNHPGSVDKVLRPRSLEGSLYTLRVNERRKVEQCAGGRGDREPIVRSDVILVHNSALVNNSERGVTARAAARASDVKVSKQEPGKVPKRCRSVVREDCTWSCVERRDHRGL
jgi:hypothetical protein